MANIQIIDKEYVEWIKDLAVRFKKSQIKAAVKVNNSQPNIILQQVVAKFDNAITPQLGEHLEIFQIPWGHHVPPGLVKCRPFRA